jgi:RNA polymerase sigma-70 factor, ECF subfamily
VSERQLIGECIRGSGRAWEQLVDQYGQAVYDAARYTLRRVLGAAQDEDVENVYQGVFLGLCDRGFHRLRLFQGRSSFKTWITSVTTRFALNYVRTEKRKGSLRFLQLDDGAEELPDRDLLASAPADEQERVYRAMAQLPHRERLLLRLAYFDGLSIKGIAEVMRISVNSVSSLMSRARENLKRLVGSRSN